MRWPPVCPAFPLGSLVGPFRAGWCQVVAGVGGPQAALKSPSQLSCQGQSLGRWMTSRLADLARRPGTAISCLRIVAVVALAWKTDARAPAAPARWAAVGLLGFEHGQWGVGEHPVVAVAGEELTLPIRDVRAGTSAR